MVALRRDAAQKKPQPRVGEAKTPTPRERATEMVKWPHLEPQNGPNFEPQYLSSYSVPILRFGKSTCLNNVANPRFPTPPKHPDEAILHTEANKSPP